MFWSSLPIIKPLGYNQPQSQDVSFTHNASWKHIFSLFCIMYPFSIWNKRFTSLQPYLNSGYFLRFHNALGFETILCWEDYPLKITRYFRSTCTQWNLCCYTCFLNPPLLPSLSSLVPLLLPTNKFHSCFYVTCISSSSPLPPLKTQGKISLLHTIPL